jgi:glucokinase
MIITGDVGGTNTRLATFDTRHVCSTKFGTEPPLKLARYPSNEFKSLADIIELFKQEHNIKHVDAACLGVPGPVFDGCVKVTNLPWEISEVDLALKVPCSKVKLVNDLAASAYNIPYLKSSQTEVLYPGDPQALSSNDKSYAIVSPGTGLGQAFLRVQDEEAFYVSSEGGHVDFAPTTDLQEELLKFYRKKIGTRISVERFVSGPGIRKIFEFLVATGKVKVSPENRARIEESRSASAIGELALAHADEACVETIEVFCELLASHLGSSVLTYLCTGGVFLGGGIVPKILPFIRGERFRASYMNKGRMSNLVKSTKVTLITDDYASLYGAARIAQRTVCFI